MDSNNPKILAPTPSQWRQHSWDFESNLNLRTFPTRRNATTATLATVVDIGAKTDYDAQTRMLI